MLCFLIPPDTDIMINDYVSDSESSMFTLDEKYVFVIFTVQETGVCGPCILFAAPE
jgi:hypothetical protein